MFGIGSTELLIIVVVALIVIGPAKLPELMRSLGKGLAEFRQMGQDVKSTLDHEIEVAEQSKRKEEAEKELFGDKAEKKSSEEKSTEAAEATEKKEDAKAGEKSA